MDGGLGHRKASSPWGSSLSVVPPDRSAELRRRAERLDTAWLMALSPMLILVPAETPRACRALAAAACGHDLRPRLVRVGAAAGQGHADLQAVGLRAHEMLDLAPGPEALARLTDWASIEPPASLWAPWREDDPSLFDLADRLADKASKTPVLFEYLLGEAAPAEARAFVLDDGSALPPLYLALD